MNTLSRFIEPLGWTLLHFLWQGTAVALLLAIFHRLARRSTPQVRYVASGVALVLMLVAAAGTVWWQMGARGKVDKSYRAYLPYRPYNPAEASVTVIPAKETAGELTEMAVPPNTAALPETPPHTAAAPPPVRPAPALVTAADRLRPLLPWLVAVWAAGVAVFSLRLVNGWRMVRRWRASGTTGLPEEWCTRFIALCARMRLSRPVQLLSSAVLTVPVVIGWLKPVVLVPAGLFSGISTAQLEAILAHELAHVRRHDYLINLLQTIVETVLFYHPAVWWVSSRLRVEREHCCDDIAASLDGDALGYARALATLEELRALPAAGLSAAGGSLFQRIRRLAGLPDQRTAGIAWPLGILTFSAMAAVLPYTLLHAAEPAFTPPQAAHISSERRSSYCVHDGKETQFVLLSGISFNSSTTSGANSKLRTWHDDGKITWDRAGEVTFSRTSENPGVLSLTYSPDIKAVPVTAAYELSKGRVFILVPGIAPQQVALDTPPVRSQEGLETLYNDVAAKLEADARRALENAGPVTSGTITVGPALTISSAFTSAAAEPLQKNGRNLGVFDLTFINPATKEIDDNPQLELRYPETSPFEPANARSMVESALKDDTGLKLWEVGSEKSQSPVPGVFNGVGYSTGNPIFGPFVLKLDHGIPIKDGDTSFIFGQTDATPTKAGTPRTPANEELAGMAFGETHTSGLRAAWVLTPPAPSHVTWYPVGSILNCRVVFHNNGKKPVKFRTDGWHQDDQWIVKNAAGQEVKVKTVRYTGTTSFKDITLKPGEICEVPAHGVGIGEGLYEEAYSTGKIGAEIPAKAGDVLTCQWVVELAGCRPDPNWTPPPDSPPATLTTGTVKITVGVADAAAKTAVGVARGTGRYDLADGIKMQVTQITAPGADGKDSYNNLATIEWYDANGTKTLEWPIQLSAGMLIDPIVWKRGGTAIWIVHGMVVRKIDYTNATDLKETIIKMDEANHPEDAPRDVLEQIVRIVRADMKRFETELEISVPAAEAAKKDAIVVSVAKSGAAKLSGEAVTDEQLTAKLTEIAKTRPDQVVIIEAEKETPATEAYRVMKAVGKSGLKKIAFKATDAAEKKSPPAPGAEGPGTSPATRAKGEMVINVKDDGTVVWNGKTLTMEELAQKLTEVAKVNRKQAIIIRGDVSTPYEKIVKVLDATHKAGLYHVSFATTKQAVPAPEEESPVPPKAQPVDPLTPPGPAPAPPEKKTGTADELKIVVAAGGAFQVNDRPVTADELNGLFTEAARAEKKPAVSIGAEVDTDFSRITKLMQTARDAGLTNVSFSTAETEDPKQAAAEKALKESAADAAAGRESAARTKLADIEKLLGKPGDKDFRDYYFLLISDALMALAKLDADQATRTGDADKSAAAKLRKDAISHYIDGLDVLFQYDRKDSSSVGCRARMGRAYIELGRLLARSGKATNDAIVAFRQAVLIFTELQTEEPKNQDHIINMVTCYNESAALIASLEGGKAAAKEALDYQNHSIAMLRRLMEEPSNKLKLGALFAATLLYNSNLLLDAEDRIAALKNSQEALDLTTALLTEKDLSADIRKKCEDLQARARISAAICLDYAELATPAVNGKRAQMITNLRDALVLLTKQASRNADTEKLIERFEQVLRAALKSDDRNAPAWHALGLIAITRGQPEEAKQDFLKAVEIDPACAQAHFNLAVIYATGDPAQLDTARKHYRAAIEAGAAHDTGLDKLMGVPPDSPPPPSKETPAPAAEGNQVFNHENGTRTEVFISKDEIKETTLSKDGVCIAKRVFYTDGKGRRRQAVIYDGNGNPMGTILYGYDKTTDQLVEEQQFNKDGKLIRRLFYPGALKDPKYAGRFVAFSFGPNDPKSPGRFLAPRLDPDQPDAGAKVETTGVSPTRPVSEAIKTGQSGRRLKLRTLIIPSQTKDSDREKQLALASELREKLTKGADFAALAKQFSADGKQEADGDWGWVREGNLTPQFWTSVSKLTTGQLSEVVPFQESYYIFRVEADGETFSKILAQAKGFFDLGQYEKAKELYGQALKLDPGNGGARTMLDSVQVAQNRADAPPADASPGIVLTVTDSTGKVPMPEFRVIAGVRAGSAGGKDTINWQPHTLRVGKEGGLIWPMDRAYDEMALRVEADGYLPQVFNWIEKKKAPQDLFFQMEASKGFPSRIFTPEGKPAAGATIALAMTQRDAVLENGKLRHAGEALPEKPSDRWRWPVFVTTGAGGEATIPAENDPTAALLIVHESGVLEISLSDFLGNRDRGTAGGPHDVKLMPWSRVRGKVLWVEKPGAFKEVSLIIHRDTYGYPGIVAQYENTMAAFDGSFVFEKVLPGQVQLSCPVNVGTGDKGDLPKSVSINLPGRITHTTLKSGDNPVVIGGAGRTIKGKLTGRDKWDGISFHFHPTAPHVGFPGDDEQWQAWNQFQKSPEGPLYFRNNLKVQPDGTFEVTGVMPGDYQIFFKREGEDKYMASGKFSLRAEAAVKDPKALEDIGEFKAAP